MKKVRNNLVSILSLFFLTIAIGCGGGGGGGAGDSSPSSTRLSIEIPDNSTTIGNNEIIRFRASHSKEGLSPEIIDTLYYDWDFGGGC